MFVVAGGDKRCQHFIDTVNGGAAVWPGKDTQDWVSKLLMRLSTVGALYLGLISLIPLLASDIWGLDESIGLGGTSLLIVVGVALETIRQIKGLMMKRDYVGFIR